MSEPVCVVSNYYRHDSCEKGKEYKCCAITTAKTWMHSLKNLSHMKLETWST